MDILTIGFIIVLIIFMLVKFLFELYMYKNSVYEVLYSSFTEYRMRKKSIEGMSESYQLKEVFGPHRILYHINEKGNGARSAYATVFLTSGCYTIAVNNETKNVFSEVKKFMNLNIEDQLKNTVYHSLSLQTNIFVISSNHPKLNATGEKTKGFVIERNELISKITEIHHQKKSNLSKIDIDGIFYTLAEDSIESEKVSVDEMT
ncbi:MAG: hypothetical protein WBI17_04980 [Clostridiaceae bacterium]